MFVVTQLPAARTGHLSATHLTMQTTTELEFREALSPPQTLPRSDLQDAMIFTFYTHTEFNGFPYTDCRKSACAEIRELLPPVVGPLCGDLSPLLVSQSIWILPLPQGKMTRFILEVRPSKIFVSNATQQKQAL